MALCSLQLLSFSLRQVRFDVWGNYYLGGVARVGTITYGPM